MAVNQAKIIEKLEILTTESKCNEFIYGFMEAYSFSASTIAQVRLGAARNFAKQAGHVGIKNKLYYQPSSNSSELEAEFDERIVDQLITKNKIRFVLVTNFSRLLAWDTKTKERLDIELEELPRNYGFFLPLVGLEKAILGSENPADVTAAEKMGKLFDLIKVQNDISKPADIHALNVFLTRILFCLFAEDTGIFKGGQFTSVIKNYTEDDGSDLDSFLDALFQVLNTPDSNISRPLLPKHLSDFPYVNGGLFACAEKIPYLGKKGRRILLDCCDMNWGEINPDIFGSMFQGVIDVYQRSRLGQHYTSYSNIMKVIQPLFLDPLRAELDRLRNNANGLKGLLVRLGQIKVFDPACGSGNFLIVAYKELRQLEMQVIQALQTLELQAMFVTGIHLDQFHGIEIDDFACEIARLSLWLAEHQINNQWQKEFGFSPPTLPLSSTGRIIHGNSLIVDWCDVCPKSAQSEVYVIGNPPFLGTSSRADDQKLDMQAVFQNIESLGNLDYVACWFWKGAQYIHNSRAELALVSTNSICQGEQVGTLWPLILNLGLQIHFAYQTFTWTNNARDKAAVHVVVIGLSSNPKNRKLFHLIGKEWHATEVHNISPYLIEGKNIAVKLHTTPLSKQLKMIKGNEATDDGHLILDKSDLDNLLEIEPGAACWIRPFVGGNDFLNGGERWCLWLHGISPVELSLLPNISKKVEKVRQFRLSSPKAATRKRAVTPWLFGENRQPLSGNFIVVPKVSSQRRTYVPIAFMDSSVIVNNTTQFIPNASLYEFAILQSAMHMAWISGIGGKMKSDYQYSINLIYNTFYWPEVTPAQRKEIEDLAEGVLFTREDFLGRTLAELYDPDYMPVELLRAHQALDHAVDRLYREKPFKSSAERLNCLLLHYESMLQTLNT